MSDQGYNSKVVFSLPGGAETPGFGIGYVLQFQVLVEVTASVAVRWMLKHDKVCVQDQRADNGIVRRMRNTVNHRLPTPFSKSGTKGGNCMLKKSEQQIVCVAQFTAKEGKEEELLAAMHALIPATRSEEGNIRYELNQAMDAPRTITFIEKFASQDAFDYHCNTPYIKQFFETVPPKLVETFVVTLYKEVLP